MPESKIIMHFEKSRCLFICGLTSVQPRKTIFEMGATPQKSVTKKLSCNADKVEEYFQDHLMDVFGSKDTIEPGNGLSVYF